MVVRELRVRYGLKNSANREVIHAVICTIWDLKYYTERVKECGYRLVGIDERYRDEDVRMPLSDGWTVIKEWATKEEKPINVYLSFA